MASGNLLSVINVLMQLRKVCNHPNLFEVRPTISPFRMDGINYRTASLVYNMLDYDPLNVSFNLFFIFYLDQSTTNKIIFINFPAHKFVFLKLSPNSVGAHFICLCCIPVPKANDTEKTH